MSVLNRSRVLAAKIANELRNKRPEHFVDEFSLADIYYSLEHVADVLSAVNGSQAQHSDLRFKNGMVCEALVSKASYLVCVVLPARIDGGST